MADDLVTFNIRFEKLQYALKMKTPSDFHGFNEKLKNELNVEDTDELVILCPTPEGKMAEIKSDDDVEYLKKTKLCYNAVSKEIYCNVELVVTIIRNYEPNSLEVQMATLSKKVDQLSSQFVGMSQSLHNKIEENSASIQNSIRSILLELPLKNPDNTSVKNSTCEPNNSELFNPGPKFGIKQKKPMTKEVLSTNSSSTSTVSYNTLNSSETLNQQKKSVNENKTNDIDTLLQMLGKEGFTNTIQNIIVLKRFENDFDKSLSYLRSSNT